MKISVITACLNSAATIEHTLRSFCSQSHPSKELIIVDGGSRDDTLRIAADFSSADIRVIPESIKGIFCAMDRGLQAFSGDAVGFLNSDDAFHDFDVLARIAEALHVADIAYGDIVMVEDHETKRPVRSWRAGAFDRRALRWGWMPPHPSFYVRRTVIEGIGGFDLRFRLASDYEFMLRALLRDGLRVEYIPHVLVDFMIGGSSTRSLSTMIRGNLECARARRSHLGTAALDAALLLKPLRKIGQIRWL